MLHSHLPAHGILPTGWISAQPKRTDLCKGFWPNFGKIQMLSFLECGNGRPGENGQMEWSQMVLWQPIPIFPATPQKQLKVQPSTLKLLSLSSNLRIDCLWRLGTVFGIGYNYFPNRQSEDDVDDVGGDDVHPDMNIKQNKIQMNNLKMTMMMLVMMMFIQTWISNRIKSK